MKAIEVKSLTYVYPSGSHALVDVNLSIEENETVGVVGPNGAGKTTLLLCICGVLSFRGSVEIFGKKMEKRNLYDLRRKIGFVFQNPDDQLFMPTVHDDVAFGPRQYRIKEEEVKALVSGVLTRLGIEHLEWRSSHHLSLGEKKKVALATALVLDPPILIFDEPTSELDPASKREFKQIIEDLRARKKTILIATHDMDLVKEICEKVIILNGGRLIYSGPTIILNDIDFLRRNRLA